MANQPVEIQLFEVNLISDQVSTLLRRRALQQISGAVTVGMLAIGTALALLMAMHLQEGFRIRSKGDSRLRELKLAQDECAMLDASKAEAIACAKPVAALLPIARSRVAWAPKLAAVANLLQADTGIVSLHASQRDVFVVRAPGVPRAPGSGYADEAGLPQMMITIVYARSGGGEEPPTLFTEKLKGSPAFMAKFNLVQLEQVEQDNWLNKPVVYLRTFARGVPPQ